MIPNKIVLLDSSQQKQGTDVDIWSAACGIYSVDNSAFPFSASPSLHLMAVSVACPPDSAGGHALGHAGWELVLLGLWLRASFISKALFTVKVVSFGRDSGKYHGMDLFLYAMD